MIDSTGKIFHMDFSENISQMYKNEPQSSHFNKAQYSLHCTVEHQQNEYKYNYHLSDEKVKVKVEESLYYSVGFPDWLSLSIMLFFTMEF